MVDTIIEVGPDSECIYCSISAFLTGCLLNYLVSPHLPVWDIRNAKLAFFHLPKSNYANLREFSNIA